MIHRLTIENFRSFNEKVEMDFTAKPGKANVWSYAKTKTGEIVSRVNMLMGPNASGKSNAHKALVLLYWALLKSAEQNGQNIDFLFQFFGNKSPVRIGFDYSDGTEELFHYEIALLPQPLVFVEEHLSQRVTKNAEWETIFDRKVDEKSSAIFFEKTTGDWASIPQRANASLIGSCVLAGSKPGVLSPEVVLARKIYSFVQNITGNYHSEYDEPEPFLWHTIGQKLDENGELLRQAAAFMQKADIGITDLATQKHQIRNAKTGQIDTVAYPVFRHSVGSRPDVSLPFNYESVGTRILLSCFAEAYPVAIKSGCMFFDEIERGIHPHLLPELVNALTPPDTTSQLFLVSHSDYLLRHLDHGQVFLTEKQDDGSTDIYRADDIEGFKADRNLLNWYHAGKLGAIPRL